MDEIWKIYLEAIKTASDINEHLLALHLLAKDCSSVTEMGTREGNSTSAFLASGTPLTCYDVKVTDKAKNLHKIALDNGYKMDLNEANTCAIEIDECDLLFLDTWHIYEQLEFELRVHGPKAQKYIACHDTVTFAKYGDNRQPYGDLSKYTALHEGYDIDVKGYQHGLIQALAKFLDENKEWNVYHHYNHNNGLTILRRS